MAPRGRILRSVPRDRCGYFDAPLLATFFSFMLEEQEGVNLDQRYDGVLCIGPTHTAYGARILPEPGEASDDSAAWADRFGRAGLVIDEIESKLLEALMNAHELEPIAAIDFPTYELDDDF